MTAQLSLSVEQLVHCGMTSYRATAIVSQMNQECPALAAINCWQHLTQHVLKPDDPFPLHQLLYETIFAEWEATQGPPPAWVPTDEQIQATHIAAFMRELHIDSYSAFHAWSVQNRAEFWHRMIQRLGIRFQKPASEIIHCVDDIESPEWLVGARFNIVDSCFQASPEAPAIIFQSADGTLSYWTYGELQVLTNRVANRLIALGLQPGEAIAIAMPMTAESVAIYLGIVKAGYVVVSIADSFAAHEILTRLRIAKAKAIFTQDVIVRQGKVLPLYAKVVAAEAPIAILLQSALKSSIASVELRAGDRLWDEFLSPYEQNDRPL